MLIIKSVKRFKCLSVFFLPFSPLMLTQLSI